MKRINLILLSILTGLVFSILIIGCANTQDSSDNINLMKNDQVKKQAFQQILNNRQLFIDFMNEMMQNHQSMQWMMGNSQMMHQMFGESNLHYMMQQNSNMRNYMMQNMMSIARNDSSFARQWNQMMQHHQQMGMRHMH